MNDKKEKTKIEYTSVKIPKVMSLKIRKLIKNEGYRSVSDFVVTVTRSRLDQLETWDSYIRKKRKKKERGD